MPMHTRSKLAIACALALTLLYGCSSDDDGVDPGPGNVPDTVPGDVVPGTPPNDPGTDPDTDPGTDNPPSAPDDAPFTEPDPAGASVVSRLGYRDTLARADALVTADYLDLLFDVEPGLISSLEPAEFFATEYQDRSAECTGGGRAVLSSGDSPFDPISVVFDGCRFEDRTFDGAYTRTFSPSVFGSGASRTIEAVMDGLRIDADDAGSLLVTGTTTRVDGETGFCPDLPGDFRDHTGTLTSAVVVDEAGETFTISDATFSESLQRQELDVDTADVSEAPGCTGSVETRSFDAAATVQGATFGTEPATLTRSGTIVRDPREDGDSSATASISATFGDGSSVAATLTDDATGTAQIDVTADGVSTSFDAPYAFAR